MAEELKTMSTNPVKPRATERDDPRRTFETAISELERKDLLSLSQKPIFARRAVDGGSSEKQAITDAARALARLWNVSSVPIR
jgi:hypothetical protein